VLIKAFQTLKDQPVSVTVAEDRSANRGDDGAPRGAHRGRGRGGPGGGNLHGRVFAAAGLTRPAGERKGSVSGSKAEGGGAPPAA
jgi:hypothetical protein